MSSTGLYARLLAFVLRRILQSFAVMAVVAFIAFAIITETAFQWPGMALLLIQPVNFADLPVMAAYLCRIALGLVLLDLIVDLLCHAVDPRLRLERVAAY